MRGAAREVKPLHVGAAVRRLERAVDRAVAGDAVDRAVQHVIAFVDVLRRQRALHHDALLDVGHPSGALELLDDRAAVARQHFAPVVMRAQIGRVHQDIERLAAPRRHARLRARGRADVTGRIGRRLAAAIDVFELLMRIVREHEIMVQHVVVGPVEAEIQHHARAGRLIAPALSEPPGRIAAHQFVQRAHRVHVRHHGVAFHRLAGRDFDRYGAAACGDDARDARALREFHVQLLGQLGESNRHGPRAAHRVPHAFMHLHRGDGT